MDHAAGDGVPVLERVRPFELDELVEASRALYIDEGVQPPSETRLRVALNGRLRRDAEALLFRAHESGPPIAFVLHARRPGTPAPRVRIEQFRVEPAWRRAGWGRRCVRALLGGPLADAACVEVRVLADNAAGIAFWQSLGFGSGHLALAVVPRPAANEPLRPA